MPCPGNQSLETKPGQLTASAVWQDTGVFDLSGNMSSVTCHPLSGSEFPIGQTWVTCRGADGLNNITCVFQIDVTGTFIFQQSQISVKRLSNKVKVEGKLHIPTEPTTNYL